MEAVRIIEEFDVIEDGGANLGVEVLAIDAFDFEVIEAAS